MAAKKYLISDGPSLNFNLGISCALLLSQFLLSTTYFDRSFIVVVDSLLMWTLTAAVAEERVTLNHDSERKRTVYVY